MNLEQVVCVQFVKNEIGRCEKFQIRKIQNHIKVIIS